MRNFLFSAKPWGADIAVLLLRVTLGMMMLFGHGWVKILKFDTLKQDFPDVIGLPPNISLGVAVFAEVFCSVCIIAGFSTRLALIPLIFTMAGAVGIVHIGDAFQEMEKAMLYLFPYLVLFMLGAGRLSLDAIINHQKGMKEVEESVDPW